MVRIFDASRYVNISGCWYPRNYEWIAYPYQSFPHGGVFNKLPDYYQNYEEELRKMREKRRQARDKEEQDRWRGKYKGSVKVSLVLMKNKWNTPQMIIILTLYLDYQDPLLMKI